MKRISLSLLTLAFAASATAQAPNRAALEKAILANEKAVNLAFEKGDLAGIQKHLLSEGVAVDPVGATPVPEMLKMLGDMKVQPGWKVESSRFLWLDDNTVMHIYKWTGKVTVMGQPLPSPTWSSTLWVLRNGQWKAGFHQETAAMAPPPTPPTPTKK